MRKRKLEPRLKQKRRPANVEVEAKAYAEAKTEATGRRSQAKTGVRADAKAKAAAELRVEAIFTAEAGISAKTDPIDAVAGRRRQWRQRHYCTGIRPLLVG